MEAAEEEMHRREEFQRLDLLDNIGLTDFISERNLSDRGR